MGDYLTESDLFKRAKQAVESGEPQQLSIDKHIAFLIRHLNVFPEAYNSLDSNQITLLYFALSGLDLLGELDSLLSPTRRQEYIDWIYRLQYTKGKVCGFRGSHACENSDYDVANLAQTYSALLSLVILGDDLSRVDRTAILETIKRSQRENGCFWSQDEGSESDMRFVFCAVAICHILHDESVIDWKKLSHFIKQSVNIDGGIGQGPGDESHGGSTFCAIASLSLSNRLWNEEVLTRKQLSRLVRWSIQKQDMGFHGRAHKPDDSCYAFWIGATLNILGSYNLVSTSHVREFLMIAQHPHIGGFCKLPEVSGYSDLLHTYFSIAALSLMHHPSINPVHSAMNVSKKAYEKIAHLKF